MPDDYIDPQAIRLEQVHAQEEQIVDGEVVD
jgi:hypothetical protein